ncbi:MAG: PorV/PorQ family protein [candidate division FCPU426 bacterium]
MKARLLRLAGLVSMLACLLAPANLPAAFDKGGVLGVGARATGMGDAYTAIADDSTAPFWNPAGLIQLQSMELSAFFGPLLNGKEYYMAGAFAVPFQNIGSMGVSVVSLYHDTGSDQTRASENTYLLTFGTPLNVERTVAFGVNLKLLQYDSAANATLTNGQVIYAQASGLGVDLGFLYQIPLPRLGKRVSFGLFAQDLDTVLRWQSGVEERVPLLIQIGSAYWLEENLSISVDYSFFNDTNISGRPLDTPLYDANGNPVTSLEPQQYRPHVGLEGWFFSNHLGLRTGYTGFATSADRFTAGVSYKTPSYGVDYAYMGHAEHLGDSHRVSGHFDFGAGGDHARVVALVNPPSNLRVEGANNGAHLSWNANPDGHVTGYSVYMSKAPGVGYTAVQKRISENKVIVDGLTNGTRYYFVVTSMNNSWPAVESSYSPEVSIIPGPVVPGSTPSGGAIRNGVYQAKGFPPLISNIQGYNLYMSTNSGSGFKRVNGNNLIRSTTHIVRGLEPNRRYFFVFTSVSNSNPPVESRPSQEWSANSMTEDQLPQGVK